MKLRLFPQERAGLVILSNMAQELSLAVQTLAEMFGAPARDFEALAEQMRRHEATSTALYFSLMTQMRTSFINPLPREDLFTLCRWLAEAMEKLDGAAELIVLYKLDRVSPRASEQLDIIGRQAELAAEVMRRLDDLDEAEDYWVETLRLAKRAEHTHRVYVAELLTEHQRVPYVRHRDLANQLVEVSRDLRGVATSVGSIIVKEA